MVNRCSECGAVLPADISPGGLCPRCLLNMGLARDNLIGQTVSHYKVLDRLSGESMGIVYRAQDSRLDRLVALKVLPERLAQDEQALKRFKREARIASALNHPHICTIHDIGDYEGQPFIVIEVLEGQTLKYLLRDRSLSTRELLRLAIQIADALAAAHSKGIIHRDIKSANIFFTARGDAKVLDFGLAKLTQEKPAAEVTMPTAETGEEPLTGPGATLGTVTYMSPEQALGRELDARSDLFSLGVVLYEMATRVLPFQGNTSVALFDEILHKTPVSPVRLNPELPETLDRVIARLLEKDPNLRHQTALDLHSELVRLRRDTMFEQSSALARRIVTTKEQPSIAVLPFVNMSPDPENEYFSDGLAEDVINALTQVEGLRVAARTSAFNFKGSNKSIHEIGDRLNVNTVLEGSVRKLENRLRITAQLINVADGYHLWSEQYNRQMEDVFEVQDDITKAIVAKLRVGLARDSKQTLVRRHTDNLKAYNLYLKGRHFWSQRTPEGLRKGMEYFQKAIELDPSYALAHAGLAESYSILGVYGLVPRKEVESKATAAAAAALELDDQLAESHFARGLIKFWYDANWPSSETDFKRAIELNPEYALSYGYSGLILAMTGRSDAAIKEAKQAQAIDPLSPFIDTLAGLTFYMLGQYSEAVRECRKGVEIAPDYVVALWIIALSYVRLSQCERAVGTMEEAVSASKRAPIFVGMLGYVYAKSGMTKQAQNLITELTTRSTKEYVAAFCFLAVHIGLGDKEAIFEWLRKAHDEGLDPVSVWATLKPDLDLLRSDSRFTRLLRQMNLEP